MSDLGHFQFFKTQKTQKPTQKIYNLQQKQQQIAYYLKNHTLKKRKFFTQVMVLY